MSSPIVQYILVGLFFALIAAWIIVKSIRRRRRRLSGHRNQECAGCPCGGCGRPTGRLRQADRDCCVSKRRHT